MTKLVVYGAMALLAGFTASAVLASDWSECEKGKFFAEKLAEADANGDGSIGKDEHLARAEKKFAEMDTNGDGSVNAEESKVYWTAQKAEWRSGSDARKEACKGQ